MSSVPKTTRRADTKNGAPAVPQSRQRAVQILQPWGEFFISEGREGAHGLEVQGRGTTLEHALETAVQGIAHELEDNGGDCDPRLIWRDSRLMAAVAGCAGVPAVMRFDDRPELAELDAAAGRFHEAREALRLDQRDEGGHHQALRPVLTAARLYLLRLAFTVATGAFRDDHDETPFEPFALETARFVIQVEPYLHDLICADVPDYYIEALPVVVIPRPALTAKGGVL